MRFSILELLMVLVLVAVIGGLVLVGIEYTGPHRTVSATVVQKTYRPDTQSTDLAPTFGSKGGFTVVTTGKPEAFIVLVRSAEYSGSAECTAEDWYQFKEGDRVSVDLKLGRFGGEVLKAHVK